MTTTAPAPTLSQRLLRALGRDIYEAGRPIADCLTKDERIGWREAQAAAKKEKAPCE